MVAGTKLKVIIAGSGSDNESDAKQKVLSHASNELIFSVVGHVGSGNSEIAATLKALLEEEGFDVKPIRAREVIELFANANELKIPIPNEDGKLSISDVTKYQDYGDAMRQKFGHSAVAEDLAIKIREKRANILGIDISDGSAIEPDGQNRAYILDSLRHPAEVSLLRHIYQGAFILIGVVCEEEIRIKRIAEKYHDAGRNNALEFMKRDAKASEKYGQRVADTFHLSDFFIDNSVDRFSTRTEPNKNWNIPEKLSRLIKIVTHKEIVRPHISETAMYTAYGAQIRSSCLSRQVGASLIDNEGNMLAIGTNEVPKAGGGVYGEGASAKDERCAYRERPELRCCSNNAEQNDIINEIIQTVPELNKCSTERKKQIIEEIREARVGSLIEYSRAIHAEMDAILSASQKGVSTKGTRLYVTTFPCHYCARHLITAGVDEVQFVEPYLKSKALSLHDDAITMISEGWKRPSEGGDRVLFKPFTGIAPRLYKRAFMKDRTLKNDSSGKLSTGSPEWGTPWHLGKISYTQLEATLARKEESIEK